MPSRLACLAFALLLAVPLAAQAAGKKLRVAMVTSESGLGDRSFNDMMNAGMKRAQSELGISYVVVQPRPTSSRS